MIIKIKHAIKPALAFSTFLILGWIFNALNHPSHPIHSLVTPFDRATPFTPIFILPYLSWFFYMYGVLALILSKSLKKYYQTIFYYNVGQIICFFCFCFYRTTVPRPIVTGHDIFSKLVINVYAHDLPYNCFPSIHVLTTFIFMLMFWPFKSRAWLWWLIESFGTLIIVSTLFVKQHVLLDVISAISVVLLMHFVWVVVENYLVNKKSSKERTRSLSD